MGSESEPLEVGVDEKSEEGGGWDLGARERERDESPRGRGNGRLRSINIPKYVGNFALSLSLYIHTYT